MVQRALALKLLLRQQLLELERRLDVAHALAVGARVRHVVEEVLRELARRLDALADAGARTPLLLQLREPGLPGAEFERLFGRRGDGNSNLGGDLGSQVVVIRRISILGV